MIKGFRYRILEIPIDQNKIYYYPEFKITYSNLIRNIFSSWKSFKHKTYGMKINKFGDIRNDFILIDKSFDSKQEALDFLSHFSKEYIGDLSSSPLTHNKEQKKLFKIKVEEV